MRAISAVAWGGFLLAVCTGLAHAAPASSEFAHADPLQSLLIALLTNPIAILLVFAALIFGVVHAGTTGSMEIALTASAVALLVFLGPRALAAPDGTFNWARLILGIVGLSVIGGFCYLMALSGSAGEQTDRERDSPSSIDGLAPLSDELHCSRRDESGSTDGASIDGIHPNQRKVVLT